MKKRFRIIQITIILSLLWGLFSLPADVVSQTTATRVFVNPALSTAKTCETHTIAISVENVVDLTAFELKIFFDPAVVEITGVENAGWLVDPGEDAFYSPANNDGEWNTDGYILFGMAQQGDGMGDPTPKTGSGDLIEITMQALVPNGTTTFIIDAANSMLVDWPDAFEIDFTTTNGVVNTANCPPTANDQTLATYINTPLGIVLTGSDPDDDPLQYLIQDNPTHGALSGTPPNLTYTPSTGFVGTDSFTFLVYDGYDNSAIATITIEVKDVPVAVADTYDLPEDGSLSVDAPGVLGNDLGPAGEELVAVLVSDIPAGEGTLVFNADGSFTYTPPAGWTGTTSFTYKACYDGICSDPVTVTLEVKQVPVAVADAYEMAKDTILTEAAPGVLGNDTGGAGATLTAELVTDVSVGTLNLNADGNFDYTPTADWTGTATFTYKACDGTVCSDPVTVSIEVKVKPTAVDDAYQTPKNVTLTVLAAEGVLLNDSGGAGAALTAELVTDVSVGTLTLNADGSFEYVPQTNMIGTVTFTYKACDGEVCSAPATVTITVADVPVAVADSYDMPTGGTLNVDAPGVLGNDLKPTGVTALTAVLEGTPPTGLTLNPDGSFTYTPPAGFVGTTTFSYRACYNGICSDPVTVTIEVKELPAAVADEYQVAKNSTLSVPSPGVLSNDTAPVGKSLTADLVTDVDDGTLLLQSTGAFVYIPPFDFVGTKTFTYRACYDGDICSAPATVTILVKAMPVAVADNYEMPEDGTLTISAPGVLGNDTGGAGATLIAELVNDIPVGEGNLTLNADGSLTYTPPADWTGSTTFTYKACDGTVCSEPVTVTIVVKEVPVAVDDDYQLPVNTTLNPAAPGVLGNDSGGAGASLWAQLVSDIPVGEGSLTLNTDGSFSYTPPTDWTGTTTFTYKACDGMICSAPATVTIVVKTVPVAVDDDYVIPENGTLTEVAPGVLDNDTGGVGATLIAELVNDIPVGEGNLTLNADGSITYTPPADWTGTTTFTYKACDGTICSAPATVTIVVKEVPIAVDDDYQLPVNTTLTPAAPGVLGNDTGGAGASLWAQLVSDIPVGEGSLTLNADGSFSYTPPIDWTGTTTFTYKACDGMICSTPATVTLAVKGVPVSYDDQYYTFIDETLTVPLPGVLANDLAPNGAPLTAELVDGIPVGEGTLTFNSGGSFVYVPPAGWVGMTSFTYKACNDAICSDPATVTIRVLETSCLVVDPASLEKTLAPDQTGTLTFSLTNQCSYYVDFELKEGNTFIREGFEAGIMPPAGGWIRRHRGDTNFRWTIKDAQVDPEYVDEGRYAAWVTYDDNNSSDEWLLSPTLDPSALSDLHLAFRAFSSTEYPGATMKVWVTNALGVPLSTEPLWDMIRDETWNGVEYRSVFVDLSAYAGYSKSIRIAWQYVGQAGQSFGLDMVDISSSKDISWLSMDPLIGRVPAGRTRKITVNFDSTGLDLGDYFAAIFVENEPYPVISVPVTLHVISEGSGIYLPLFYR